MSATDTVIERPSDPTGKFRTILDSRRAVSGGVHDGARRLATLVGVALVYVGSAQLGLLAAVAHPVVSSLWPPAGVALAALLILGLDAWPAVTVGAFLVNWTAGLHPLAAAAIAGGNTLEALLAATWLRRWPGFRSSLGRFQDVVVLALLAAGLSTAISATIGVTSLWLAGVAVTPSVGHAWVVWWSGDALGDLLVAPVLLTWRRLQPERRWAEAVGLAIAVPAATWLLLRGGDLGYAYAVFPLIVWAAVRLGPRGAAAASLLVAVLCVSRTLAGAGPFSRGDPLGNLAILQLFLAVLALTGLLLAALTTERGTALHDAREAEQVLRVLVEGVEEYAIYWADGLGRVINWNVGAQRLHGYAAEDILGRNVQQFYTPEDVAAGIPATNLQRAAEQGHTTLEAWRLRKDGSQFWAEVTTTAVRDASGALLGFAKLTRDLSERRAAQARLGREVSFVQLLQRVAVAANQAASAEEALRTTLREVCQTTGWAVGHVYLATPQRPGALLPSAIWHEAEHERNAPFRAMTEVTPLSAGSGLLGRVFANKTAAWLPDLARDADFRRTAAATRSGLRAAFALPVLAGGEVTAVMEFFAPRIDPPDQPLLDVMTHVGTQVGRVIERARAEYAVRRSEADLMRSREQFRQLASRIESLRESDRIRIAREVHDDLGQVLTALSLDLAWLKTRLPRQGGNAALAPRIDKMAGLVDTAAFTVTRIATDLRPPLLDAAGLPAGVRWQAQEFQDRTGIACDVDVATVVAQTLPEPVATAAFRIFQEALTNVAQHARASHVHVSLQLGQDAVTLEVRDDGCGITPRALGDVQSLGLLGMRERAAVVGGVVRITGVSGAGTTVTFTAPRA